ncbi:hypothetical protein [Leptospira santarosai]|uniref:hypothetical protein n=1 Tax=Leptospira santarosai TaxID=28183 RepID=UPI0002BE55E7|nr:hypothetical protein [Leptospira santarosai]EMO14672.1 hypothetical protein LEP1GSC165_0376 [Leptospira santarosai str. CBC523]EMO21528.1 hypothetical protein LEP1GSC168_4194 [Leptospira santarosai str. HAI134]MDI7182875.1 hypothetical protein [Leptospira santarosai]
MKSFKNDFLKDNLLRSYVDAKVLSETNARISENLNLISQISSKINLSEKGALSGVATLGPDGILVLSQRPSIPYSGNVFVFRPGETTPTGNVFASWNSLLTAVAGKSGLKFIQFDDSLQTVTIPIDNVNFSDCILLPRFKKQTPLAITFTSGFLISSLPLEVQSLNLKFSSHFFDNLGSNTLTLVDSSLEYSGSGNGIDFFSGSLTVYLKNSSILGNGRTVFSMANSSLQIVSISGLCSVESGCISGNTGSTLTVTNLGANFPASSLIGIQSGFLGTKVEQDHSHVLEKTLISKGQLITRNASGNFVSLSPGLDNEILIFDSNTQSGLRSSSLGNLFSLPGMKSISDYVRQSSPSTQLLSAGSKTLDCSLSNLFRITGGNANITLSNLTENQAVNVIFESTGSAYIITWSGGTFLWQGASVPVPTSVSSRKDFYSFIKVGGLIFGSCVLNMG